MAESIFDLNMTGDLPPVNQGVTQYKYDKIPPTRSATGTQFTGGPIDFQFSMAGNKWWVPARSYLRIRMLVGTGAVPPVAPAFGAAVAAPIMNSASALFTEGSVYLEDMELSKINRNMSEIDTLKKRMNKSGAWLNGIGENQGIWDPDFNVRLSKVSLHPNPDGLLGKLNNNIAADTTAITAAAAGAAGTITFVRAAGDIQGTGILESGDIFVFNTRPTEFMRITGWTSGLIATFTAITAVTAQDADNGLWYRYRDSDDFDYKGSFKLEYIWKPPFSIFDVSHALPLGNYRMSLQPANNFVDRVVQTLEASVAGTGYNCQIDRIDFFVASMIGPRMKDATYYLDLDEIQVQTAAVSDGSSESHFVVSPKTYALTVAFADSAAGTDSLYPVTLFKNRDLNELTLTKLQVQYAEQNKPAVQADPTYSTTSDYFTQRYADTYLYSGMYFDSAGPETYLEYIKRGPYFYLPFPKDDEDESTRAIVRYTMGTYTNTRIILFNHYKRVAIVEVQNGRVQNVRTIDR